MKHLLLLCFLLVFCGLNAQKIQYAIPEGYESTIIKKDYKFLVDESIKAISKYYKIASLQSGVIQLEEGQDFSGLNLHNLILNCADVPKAHWPVLINAHFDGMYESMEKQKQLDPNKFETLRDYLSIRIYQEAYVDQNGGKENFILRKDLDDTFSVLVLDLPSAFVPIQKEVFDLWGKSAEEVFEIAQKNVNSQEFMRASHTLEIEGNEVEINFIENDDYGASIALDLINNTPEFVGEWGSVIALPNKGIVDICKISKENPLDFMLFIQAMKPMVEQFYSQHPQRISPHFFWYYEGNFTKINILEKDGELNVISPMGLSELMSAQN